MLYLSNAPLKIWRWKINNNIHDNVWEMVMPSISCIYTSCAYISDDNNNNDAEDAMMQVLHRRSKSHVICQNANMNIFLYVWLSLPV